MDGFDCKDAVIVLAATNRPEILDATLLRPGRFDRRVAVQAPNRAGRLKILQVHTRHTPLAADADLGIIAASTPGMGGPTSPTWPTRRPWPPLAGTRTARDRGFSLQSICPIPLN
jgi:ATP-dependent Zn protease